MTLLVLAAALGVVAVVTGIGVFVADSMARATFLLLASFVAVAVVLLAFGLAYLGIVVVLMMTIEMMIMVVFMVMLMMNPAGLEPMTMVHNRWGARLIALAVFAVLAAGALVVPWPVRPGPPGDPTTALGADLMGPQMLTMTVLGLAILATIVGTVAVSATRGSRR
ncbi:NADH-quinone oxidoreductase subunit J [Actinomycetospora sp. TBRC 11914]|uniref:NADH-quinone oxidoreductase subunit J n=1 Tax=Actinomycetospora sp. TBRC 11914 TaxID=2729387 RepID=UPI00145ED688|nr:NADH-quinone oxidoreductase subunit J [Actinomycetospora sp. TBRC 11914]NMO91120.1 NADH:ubiquinone oxidoreductase subunit J [Actinomycetospora sp. TBRC 11914]